MPLPDSPHSGPQQRVLAESAPDPILTIDEKSTILYANAAAERVFGYSAAELVGQSLLMLIPERLRQRHETGISHYVRTGERKISWQGLRVPIRTKSGVEVPVEISFGAFESHGRRLFSGFLRDISDQVAAEDAIAAANHRLQQQARTLEQQVEEAQSLSEELAQNNQEAEDRARLASLTADRARRLLSLSTRLNRAIGASEVADLILETGMLAVGADAGSFALLSRGANGASAEFEVIRTRGFTTELTREYRRFALNPGRPLSDAVIDRIPILVRSRADARERYPTLSDLGYEGFAALPVVVGDEVIAAIAFSFAEPQEFDESAETFLRTVAEQCAQALERARLYDAATGHARRSSLLAEASRLLASSLEYETMLKTFAEFAVPVLGDWCAIDIVDDPASSEWPPRLTRLAVAHEDPLKKALGLSLEERFPTDWNSHGGTPAVMRERATQFIPVLTDEMLQRAARSAEHLAALRALNFSSVIMVPLIARGLTLGVLTLVMGDSGRRFGADDVALATDLALRAATAIDNARLFRDARHARSVAESAMGRAAMASKAKSNFLATMSHEIRTPINAVLGYSELLALELAGPLTEEQRAQVERIRASTGHLLTLVNEVLDLAKIESGTLRVDVRESAAGEAVNSALAMVRLQAVAKRLRINEQCEGACDAQYVGDSDRVRQILVNLITNAVKFTREGGSVSVVCALVDEPPFGRSRRSNGPHVVFRVRDTGIGISADQLEHIFEAFVQAGSDVRSPYTREQTGTGLGLAISRQLAHQMRGEITVESQLGVGSTFTLYLPAVDPGTSTTIEE
jgi:PAS domain S-box-containing protein